MGGADNQVIVIFAAGTAGMLLLAGGVVLFVFFYQKKMLQEELKRQHMEAEHRQNMLGAALESQENERIRVSKDLHDDVGMMLMTMRAYLNSITDNNFGENIIPDIRTLVDETHETVRRLSWDLMPSTLERFGLTQTIREMCDRLSVRSAVPVSFKQTNSPSTLDKNEESMLYRIVQEAVTNALKHAKASSIEIHFEWEAPFLNVFIIDDGVGFDFPVEKSKIKIRQGLGLLNIESRASILGAILKFENNIPSGTILHIRLKVNHDG